MAESPEIKEKRGSQKWLQILVNQRRHVFDVALQKSANRPTGTSVTWLSPLPCQKYAEYRDSKFLKGLGIKPSELQHPLNKFWPTGGPRWDALGRTERDDYFWWKQKPTYPK